MKASIKTIRIAVFALLCIGFLSMFPIGVKAEDENQIVIDDVTYIIDKENGTAMLSSAKNKHDPSCVTVTIPSKISYEGKDYIVSEIGSGAYAQASYLEEVTIPSTVKVIGTAAFVTAKKLKKVHFSAGLKTIEQSAFYMCEVLEELELPETVEYLGVATFYGCDKLKKVVIPNSVSVIETACFAGCIGLEEVVLPDNLKIMESSAFSGCEKLRKVNIPDSLTELSSGVFMECDSLTEVEIPEGVKKIEAGAFDNCASLRSIVIPESVENITGVISSECENLEIIIFPEELRALFRGEDYEGIVMAGFITNEDGTLSLVLENIPEGVTDIQLPADIGGHEISSVTGPEGVDLPIVCAKHRLGAYSKDAKEHWSVCEVCKKEIREAHAFTSASQPCICGYVPFEIMAQPSDLQLAYTYKEGSLAVTAKQTFGSEAVSYQWYEAGNAITGATAAVYKIPKGKQPGSYIYSCKLTSGSYSQVTKSATVTVKAPVKGGKYKDDKNKATYKVTNARTDGKGTVEYVKPVNKKKSVVTIPATVKIGGVTYKVTSIAKNAFKNNKYIKRLTIEKNVDKIGARAFYGCKKLKNITIKTTKLKAKKIGTAAFKKTPANAKIKVPKKKLKTYKTMLQKKGVSKKAKIRKI